MENMRKLYAAEISMLKAKGIDPAQAEASYAIKGNSPTEILAAVRALHRFIEARLPSEEGENADGEGGEPAPSADQQRSDELKTEIRALSRAIQETKTEIAALGIGADRGSRIITASNELDEVVQATENATNEILAAVEKIDDLGQKLQLNAGDPAERQMAEEILESTVKIFEACNFQDITGQRITKVVNALKFIEDRIDSMIDIWGEEEIAEVAVEEETKEGDAALLNGPSMEGEGVSQDDIDKMFD